MNPIAEDILMHYGMPRRSGRYPYGSGKDSYQHGRDFLGRVEELKKNGWTESSENIKKEFGISTTEYRKEYSNAVNERRMLDVARAKALTKDGLGPTEIGRIMGKNESSIRSLLNEQSAIKTSKARQTADEIKKIVDEKGMVDIGKGVEGELGISKEKFNQAVKLLENDGYLVYKGGIPQATNPGKQINQKVLCKPGTEHKDIYDYENVHSLNDYYSHDGGDSLKKFQYPSSMNSSRLMIRYKEDGGIDKDGVMELRPGVADLSLGGSKYSQVRILVDDKKYLKGMAVYGKPDDFPPGVDVIFNTNKTKDKAKLEVLKDIKDDPGNPFGSTIKANGQSYYIGKDGKEHLSLINKRSDEGDWTEWQDALPSQFLSKQSETLAKRQLDLAIDKKQSEFNDILALQNPTIKKHFLNKFADECESAAVDLKGAALPGQKYHVIIPVNTLKDNEIYAPQYENGTKLALIRYPHGGTFEIPILTVNNKHQPAIDLLGKDVIDGVGINARVAERLSGADFDGDTVMCIPTHDKNGNVKIASRPNLEGLEGFDPKTSYPERPGMKYMKDPVTGKDATQAEMGKISNLINDMTLAGANDAEIAQAVRHSMVVIDAGKHKLDYKQSYLDNNIEALKKKYQIKYDEEGNVRYGGASTLISRSKGEKSVIKRKGQPYVNLKGKEGYDPTKPEGSLIYKESDDAYYPSRKYNKETGIMTIRTKDGKKVSYDVKDEDARTKFAPVKKVDEDGTVRFTNEDGTIEYATKVRTQASTNMGEADDAYTLVSKAKHPMEIIYADYANSMKDMARQARIEASEAGKIAYDKAAAKEYSKEVKSLNDKVTNALLNAPREREAQRRANAAIKKIEADNPDMTNKDLKKAKQRELNNARVEVESIARRNRDIPITDREWEAIQKGAISENKLNQILNNTNIDDLRQRSMPKETKTISAAKENRVKALSASGKTLNEIANALGISTSTVSRILKGGN